MTAPPDAPTITDLAFRGELRRYQRTVIAGMDAALVDDRHHVVAPPGSGKTILGLELVCRLGTPAIVFAPTTVIQRQWISTLEKFVPDGADVDVYATTSAELQAPLGVFTYQLIATPDRATDELDQLALNRWRDDLIESGVATADEAVARIEEIHTANPDAYRRELARRRQALRRELLRAPGSDVYELLHGNARALIDRIAASGVRTIVLDECHHLLDYWAIVLRALVARLDRPRTIGLTATLPDLETTREYENYIDLVGPVDFETPVPAVVREGHLAPYRDLALFVTPTEREQAWLDDVAGELARAIDDVVASPAWAEWLDARLTQPLPQLLETDGALLVAALRSSRHGGRTLPAALTLPTDVADLAGEQPPTLDDHIALLSAFVLEQLVPSDAPADHKLAARLRSVLRTFGATVTERGLRRSRSPGDLLLAVSDARIHGAARILGRELDVLGDDLRGVVVTDYDRDRSGVQVVDDVVGTRAGGARRVAQLLAASPKLHDLGIVLVTGRRLAVTAAHAATLRDALLQAADADELQLQIELAAPDETTTLVELVGSGRDWRPGIYVPLVTGAFVDGAVRIVVGTRALLGEGWDAPAANVLVDLTSVASAQAVQQLRGRTMRLDPLRPDKVAHNWDVVCIDPRSRDGNPDLRRFVRRHERLWGIVSPIDDGDVARTVARLARVPTAAGAATQVASWSRVLVGATESGVAHVDSLLSVELDALEDWTRAGFDDASRRSLDAVDQRDATRIRWGVGNRFDDQIRDGVRLRAPSNAPITAHSLRRIALPLLVALLTAIGFGFYVWAYAVLRLSADAAARNEPLVPDTALGGGVLLALLAVIVIVVSWRPTREVWQLLRSGAPADEVLADSARAVFDALRTSELIEFGVPDSALRIADRSGEVTCWLDGVGVSEGETFATCMRQLFEPVTDQRWLLQRTDGRVPLWMDLGITRIVVRIARRGARSPESWLAVPSVLARSGKRRDAFAAAWKRRVGGGRIVDGRSAEGAVARARARSTSASGRGIAEAWRSWS